MGDSEFMTGTYENDTLMYGELIYVHDTLTYVIDTLTIHHHGHRFTYHPSISDWWWLEPWIFMNFHTVGNFIILTDEVHHFSEGRSTTSQITNHGKSPFFMSKSIINGPFSSIFKFATFSIIFIIFYNIYIYIAMENGPFIDGLPIKNSDFPWLC